MRSIHLTLFGFLLLPSLALASAADFVEEEPLSQSTSVSGNELSGDTEVLTPTGILSEDAFGGTAEIPGLGMDPAGGPAAGIPGDTATESASGGLNPLYQPDAPGSQSQSAGSATSAVSVVPAQLANNTATPAAPPARAVAPAATSLTLPPPQLPSGTMPLREPDESDDSFDSEDSGFSPEE